jgi:hypothetical protein
MPLQVSAGVKGSRKEQSPFDVSSSGSIKVSKKERFPPGRQEEERT